jgi:uncharacterized membrane protein
MVFAVIVFSARAWLVPVLGVIVVLAAVSVWSGHGAAIERRVRLGCNLLKLAGVIALAACLLEPVQTGQRARPGANLFAILVDNSQSLQIKDSGHAQSRGEALRGQLTNDEGGWEAALEENFQVRRYTFDAQLQDTGNFAALDFQGRGSALWHALSAAGEQWRGQPVAGVFLFTDGNATDAPGDESALKNCPPVYPVLIGNDEGLRDISLDKVSVSQTAFEDAPVTVQAQAAARGFAGTEVVAKLTEIASGATEALTNAAYQGELAVTAKSNVVAEQRQTAREDGDLNYRFQIQPSTPGIHYYQLEVRARNEAASGDGQSGEATLANNRQIIAVDRGQRPFRVLYAAGRPNWEYKFMNRAIEDDPQVRMSGLIRIARREPKFIFKGRAGESSNPLFRGFGETGEETARYDQPVIKRQNVKDEFELRGNFPATAEELFRYDAVVLGKVEAEFFTRDQMVLLQRFVSERGGGFLMLGGAESFREGGYEGTAVGSILPVYLDKPDSAAVAGQWKLELTREGWLQPWARLRATEAEERTRLQDMAPMTVLNTVRGIKPGATVLATVSDTDNHPLPALVVQRFGLGRSAALMLGDLYTWGLHDEDSQKDLGKFWRQLVRWLVSDVPQRVSVETQPAADGDPTHVRIIATARDEEYKPLDNANVQLTIRPVRVEQSKTNGAGDFVQIPADASPTQPGKYEATFVARDPGDYFVQARITNSDGRMIGQAAAGWATDPAVEEFRSLKPNRSTLEEIAKRTGGQVLTMDALRSFARQLPNRRAPITESFTKPLWHQPGVFLFVIGCFVSEWGIRRWKGLP